MRQAAINPWSWSLRYGFSQGLLVEGQGRVLFCAGQASMDDDGNPTNAGDIRAQIDAAMDNLEAVLSGAEMSLDNIVRLTIYTTDVERMLENYDALTKRLGDVNPAETLLGVTRLAFPEMLVEIEATAVA